MTVHDEREINRDLIAIHMLIEKWTCLRDEMEEDEKC